MISGEEKEERIVQSLIHQLEVEINHMDKFKPGWRTVVRIYEAAIAETEGDGGGIYCLRDY